MIIKDIIKNNILDFYIYKHSSQERICKDIYNLNSQVSGFLSNLFIFNTVPKVNRLSEMKGVEFYETFEKINFILKSIYECSQKLKSDYDNIYKKYKASYSRLDNLFLEIQDRASELLEYNCINISVKKSNQTDNSSCSKIGKYIVLPFFRKTVSLYNSQAGIACSSNDDLVFSNTADISSIPLEKFVSFKVLSNKDLFTLDVIVSINATIANMIYFKMTNEVSSVSVKLKKENAVLKSFSYNTNEIIANFSPIEIDSVEFSITCSNLNKDKPSSIQIEDIQIFSNIIFQKYGAFESKSKKIEDFNNINTITLECENYGDKTNTNTIEMVSMSPSQSVINYNTLQDNKLDISLYKYKYKYDIYNDETINNNTQEITIQNKDFVIYSFDNASTLWDADIKRSKILYGLNDYYLNIDDTPTADQRFQTWTLAGNYYITHVLNYEDGVYVNIGAKTCIFNNKEVTGIINIPIGISKIKVHVKDIDLFKQDSVHILSKENILNDNLYPYNFMYLFAGLPEYNNSGIISRVTRGPYSKEESKLISLRESFIPFTEIVLDDVGRRYSLQLTRTTDIPGTYTIEPYAGNIRVVPFESANSITISFIKAQYNYKPCGILFNRLLTYAPIETVLTNDNSELFSLDGSSIERAIILPKIVPQANSSQIIFNKSDESLYVSTRIELQSIDKYLTPILSDIYLQTR